MGFQAKLGTWLATYLLAGSTLDPNLTGKRLRSLRFETDAPVDDIMVETEGGWIFFQAKSSLKLSGSSIQSGFGKTVDQFVRQWFVCFVGDGSRGWNRPLTPERDRLVLSCGPDASLSISVDLAQGVSALRAASSAQLSKSKSEAVRKFERLLSLTS